MGGQPSSLRGQAPACGCRAEAEPSAALGWISAIHTPNQCPPPGRLHPQQRLCLSCITQGPRRKQFNLDGSKAAATREGPVTEEWAGTQVHPETSSRLWVSLDTSVKAEAGAWLSGGGAPTLSTQSLCLILAERIGLGSHRLRRP